MNLETWEPVEEENTKPSPLDDKLDEELLKQRIVVLFGELKERMVDRVCKKLIYLGTLDPKKGPIQVILNSIGGEVYLGLLIFNTIKDLVRKGFQVEIETRGLAASMSCYILQAGSKRKASKYSRFLIHEISTYTFGKSSEVKEQAEETLKLNSMLKEILVERTNKTAEEIEKTWHKKDVWLSAEEALQFGLIDEIV